MIFSNSLDNIHERSQKRWRTWMSLDKVQIVADAGNMGVILHDLRETIDSISALVASTSMTPPSQVSCIATMIEDIAQDDILREKAKALPGQSANDFMERVQDVRISIIWLVLLIFML